MKRIIELTLILIIIFFTFSSSLYTAEEEKLKSLEKSLVFPGWGQLSEKRYLEGIIFATSELFCLAGVFKNMKEGDRYYKLYKSAENTQDAIKFRELTTKFDKRRNRFIAGAIAVWALNILDMYFIQKRNSNVLLKLGNNRVEIGFRKKF